MINLILTGEEGDLSVLLAEESQILDHDSFKNFLESLQRDFLLYLKACENRFHNLGNTHQQRLDSLTEIFGVKFGEMASVSLEGAIVLKPDLLAWSDLHKKLVGEQRCLGFVNEGFPEFIFVDPFTLGSREVVTHEWQHIVNRFTMFERPSPGLDPLEIAFLRVQDEIIAWTRASVCTVANLTGTLTSEDGGGYDYLLPERLTHEADSRAKLNLLIQFMAEALENVPTQDPRIREIGLNMLVKEFNINLEEAARIKKAFDHGGIPSAEKSAQRVCLNKPEAKSPVCEAYKVRVSQAVQNAIELKKSVDPDYFPQLLAVTPMQYWPNLLESDDLEA